MTTLRSAARAAPGAALLALAAFASGACSLAYDWGRPQCSSGADCAALGADFEGAECAAGRCEPLAAAGAGGGAGAGGEANPWACPEGSARASASFPAMTVTGRVGSVDAAAVAGASIKACGLLDVDCAAPAAGPATSDEAGAFALALPRSFSGYLEVSAEGYVPALAGPILVDTDGSVGAVDLIGVELASQLIAYVGATLGREASLGSFGALHARAFDCDGGKLAGVRFELGVPGESALVYLDNDALDFGAAQTTANGGGIFALVDPGINAVAAIREGVEVDRLGVIVRRGHLTTALLRAGRRFP